MAQGTFKNINPQIVLLHGPRRCSQRRVPQGPLGCRQRSPGQQPGPANATPGRAEGSSPPPPLLLLLPPFSRLVPLPEPATAVLPCHHPHTNPAAQLPPDTALHLPPEPRTSPGNGRAPAPPRPCCPAPGRLRPAAPHLPSPVWGRSFLRPLPVLIALPQE